MHAAIYARKSFENGYGTYEQSVEQQINKCLTYAKEKGLVVDSKHVYANVSTLDDRTSLNNLLKEASEKKFEVILVDSLNRLNYSRSGIKKILQHLINYNIRLIIIDQNMDLIEHLNAMQFDSLRKRTLAGISICKFRMLVKSKERKKHNA